MKQKILKDHPKVCPNCKEEGSITFERFAIIKMKNGQRQTSEYVCDECGWGMDAYNGVITNKGECCEE